MSTTDPAEARRELARSRRSGAVRWILIGDTLVVLGNALFSIGVYGLFGLGFAQDSPTLEATMPIRIIAFGAGLIVSILGSFIHFSAARRHSGRPVGGSPFLGIVPLAVIGWAGGAWIGWAVFAPSSWIWIPLVVTLAAVALVVLSARTRAADRRNREALSALVEAGAIVPGVVTEIAELSPGSGGLVAPVVVTFSDAQGIDRWVRKLGQWDRSEVPNVGDTVAVLFDAADPGNDKRIWIGPATADTPEAFTRWAL